MKKILSLVVVLLTFLLVSCDPGVYYFNKADYIEQIEQIELIKYANDDYEIVDASTDILKFDYKKIKKIETLKHEKIDDFLSDFEEIVFHVDNESVNEPTGYCLIWYLKNGNFIVFSCTVIKEDRGYSMVSEFDSNCNFVKHYADFASEPHFVDVLEKYFSDYKRNETQNV